MRKLAPERDRFVSLLRAHRLLGIAANDPALERDVLAATQAAWELVRLDDEAQSAAYDAELDELMTLLEPVDYIFFKGAALRRTIYRDRTLRPMNDIDVLVRKEEAASIVRLLKGSGYERASRLHHYFKRPPRNLLVEIIPRVTQETRHAIDYDEVFRERRHGPFGAPLLASHHQLATMALVIGTTMQEHARKYLDLWLLSREPRVLEGAVDTAARWKMRRVFHAATCMLTRFLPDSAKPLKEMSGSMLSRSERHLVEQLVLPRTVFRPESRRPLMLMRRLALLDSNAIRAQFLTSQFRRTEVIPRSPVSTPAGT
jgi:hypothetical protein